MIYFDIILTIIKNNHNHVLIMIITHTSYVIAILNEDYKENISVYNDDNT